MCGGPYIACMIRSFRSKALRWYAKTGDTAKLSVQISPG
jgi:hypothetical protein